MQERIYPDGTAAVHAPWRTPLIAALVALLVGAAIASGVFLLADSDTTKTVVVSKPAPQAQTQTQAGSSESTVAATITGADAGALYGTSQYRALPATGPSESVAAAAVSQESSAVSQRTPGAHTGN